MKIDFFLKSFHSSTKTFDIQDIWVLEMENSVYSIKDIKRINEEEFEAVFEIDESGLPSGLW